MEVVSGISNRSVVGRRSAVARLVPAFDGDRTVECAVGITVARLRLRGQADRIPPAEEVVYRYISTGLQCGPSNAGAV